MKTARTRQLARRILPSRLRPSSRWPRPWAIGLVIASLFGVSACSERDPDAPRAAAAPSPVPAKEWVPGLTLSSGETVAILASSLRAGKPVVLQLGLPAPPAGVESLSIRVMAEDGRVLETEAAIQRGDSAIATLEIPAAWLAATGRYVVEIQTREQTHFPLRRYAVEVR